MGEDLAGGQAGCREELVKIGLLQSNLKASIRCCLHHAGGGGGGHLCEAGLNTPRGRPLFWGTQITTLQMTVFEVPICMQRRSFRV